MASYSDLQTWRHCPRLYGFKLLGYIPAAKPGAITTGELVHAALAGHWGGEDALAAMAEAETTNYELLRLIQDYEQRHKAFKEIEKAAKKAKELLARYLNHWAKDYQPIVAELELKYDGVTTHPDLIALWNGEVVIVDFKTGRSPDVRWLDMSGQTDLAAFMLGKIGVISEPELIIYDIISKEGLFRHIRLPRFLSGERLHQAIKALGELSSDFLSDPHPAFDCPNRCGFFYPCWLLETDSEEACQDYLMANYWKKEKEEAKQ